MPTSTQQREATYGRIEIEDLGQVTLPAVPGHTRRSSVHRYRYTWTPPATLNVDLPGGFSMKFDCDLGSDGIRRFRPASSYRLFIDLAFTSGLAILTRIRQLDAETRHSYRAMWLVFGLVRLMQEHYDREFGWSRDLYIRPSGRSEPGQRSVLPENVGLDSGGRGHVWSIGFFTDRGRQAAEEAGVVDPVSAVAIRYGLLEAATLNPLSVEDERVLTLMRWALFKIDASEPEPDAARVELVVERLLRAVHRHLDDTPDEFNRWFSGPKSSLLKLISDKKDEQGRTLRRQQVRQAVLFLGWRAYEYVAGCIQCTMRYVQNALDLTEDEQQRFEHAFLPQPYFGGLPLALLAERGELIKDVVEKIWETPEDRNLIGILHRLLYLYGDIAGRRREADNLAKARAAGRICDAPLAREVPLIEPIHSLPGRIRTEDSAVAEHLRELHEIECVCDSPEYEEYFSAHGRGDAGDLFKFSWLCSCGREVGEVVVSLSQLQALAQEFGSG